MININTLIVTPLKEMVSTVWSFIPTLLLGMGILVIGWVIAKTIRSLIDRLFKEVEFDKFADKMGASTFLKKVQ